MQTCTGRDRTVSVFMSGILMLAFAGMSGCPSTGGSDTQAPTAPTSLTATAAGASQIDLAWTAST